jgi:hypothetical protein
MALQSISKNSSNSIFLTMPNILAYHSINCNLIVAVNYFLFDVLFYLTALTQWVIYVIKRAKHRWDLGRSGLWERSRLIETPKEKIILKIYNLQENNIMKIYGAVPKGNKYVVAEIYSNDIKPIGHIRYFYTFKEANLVAFECSLGKHNCFAGYYVNMR